MGNSASVLLGHGLGELCPPNANKRGEVASEITHVAFETLVEAKFEDLDADDNAIATSGYAPEGQLAFLLSGRVRSAESVSDPPFLLLYCLQPDEDDVLMPVDDCVRIFSARTLRSIVYYRAVLTLESMPLGSGLRRRVTIKLAARPNQPSNKSWKDQARRITLDFRTYWSGVEGSRCDAGFLPPAPVLPYIPPVTPQGESNDGDAPVHASMTSDGASSTRAPGDPTAISRARTSTRAERSRPAGFNPHPAHPYPASLPPSRHGRDAPMYGYPSGRPGAGVPYYVPQFGFGYDSSYKGGGQYYAAPGPYGQTLVAAQPSWNGDADAATVSDSVSVSSNPVRNDYVPLGWNGPAPAPAMQTSARNGAPVMVAAHYARAPPGGFPVAAAQSYYVPAPRADGKTFHPGVMYAPANRAPPAVPVKTVPTSTRPSLVPGAANEEPPVNV